MAERTRYFKVGLFVVSATIIAIIGIIVLGAGALFRKKVLVESYFTESVQGLEVGSPIKFRGVRIGEVEEIALAAKEYPTDSKYVLVRARLYPVTFRLKKGIMAFSDLKKEVEKGLRVRLSFHGLTGSAFMETDYLEPADNPPLIVDWDPQYLYIPSTQSTITRVGVAVDRIMRRLEKTNIEEITKNLSQSLAVVNRA